jgi:DDE family transposase
MLPALRASLFRGDAAFANPDIYEFLEAEGIGYTIRLPANRVLQDRIGYLLERPVGRPPHELRRYFARVLHRATARKTVSAVPNAAAIVRRIWLPGTLFATPLAQAFDPGARFRQFPLGPGVIGGLRQNRGGDRAREPKKT